MERKVMACYCIRYFAFATLVMALRVHPDSCSPAGPVVGPSPFRPGETYFIHAFWPESERARWAAAQSAATVPKPGSERGQHFGCP
jgi:hypothetical protein